MAIQEYTVVTAGEKSPEKAAAMLAERVNHAIKNGWVPYGAVVFVPDHGTAPGNQFYHLTQAMTR